MNLVRLFGSNCRVKILEKFFLEQATSTEPVGFFIRELCRDIGEQLNSVRRELMNLESLHILKSRDENKKKVYSLNKNCSLYKELSDMFLKSYDPVDRLLMFFRGKKGIDLLGFSESLRDIAASNGGGIVDIFIIGDLDRTEFNEFLEQTFFTKKVRYAIMSQEDFTKRLEYNDKLVLSILSQKNFTFAKDKLNIQETVAEKIQELAFKG